MNLLGMRWFTIVALYTLIWIFATNLDNRALYPGQLGLLALGVTMMVLSRVSPSVTDWLLDTWR